MKSVKVKYLNGLDAADMPEAKIILEKTAVENIDSVNWPEQFAGNPYCAFSVARSSNALFISFSVREENVRAVFGTDHDPVWQDSCVEFFCKLPGSTVYTNFEFNCIGTCLAAVRQGRNENVAPLPADKMQKIERLSSLGNKPFGQLKGETQWELIVKIPFSILGVDNNNFPEKLNANFYKCADGSPSPHYLSWNPILTSSPDFHRPEFFGTLEF